MSNGYRENLGGRGVLAMLALAVVPGLGACGGAEQLAQTEPEIVGASQQELLTAPGAWYTAMPAWAWCTVKGDALASTCLDRLSFNSKGGANKVNRLAAGRYRLVLAGMPAGGNFQVVPIGSSGHCSAHTIVVTPTAVGVDVSCRTAAGGFQDSSFALSYVRDTNVGGKLGGYALVRAGSGAPVVSNSWNSTGGAILATRTRTGQYTVDFGGQSSPGDTVLVSSASSTLPGHCKARSWGNTEVAVRVLVDCYDAIGGPRDMDFSISYNQNIRGNPRNGSPIGTQGGFSRVKSTGVTSPSFSRNTCVSGSNTSSRPGVGLYEDKIHVVAASPGTEPPTLALTSAVGSGPAYCNLNGFWSTPLPPNDPLVRVKCWNGTGALPTDSEHTAMFMLQGPGGC